MHISYRLKTFFVNKSGRLVATLIVILAIGWSIATMMGQFVAPANLWLPLILCFFAVLLMIVIRPALGSIAALSFAFLGPLFPTLVEVGELSLRYTDVMLGILILVICLQFSIRRRIEV